ncbi:MAG: 5-formyltetrahydrofolate cyclo-ligase [Bacillota bacterium]
MRRLSKDEARAEVWGDLQKVAAPDSRFHWDFNEFIPDYEGSKRCTERLVKLPEYRDETSIIFITPDNNLNSLRARCIKDGKPFIMPTYGIRRGFLYLDPGQVPDGQEIFASTLDGMDYFGRRVTLDQIKEITDDIEPLVTGASVITLSGIRCGKGHGFFDLEWAMLRMKGLVDEKTSIYAVAHACQVVEGLELEPTEFDSVVDGIITNEEFIPIDSRHPKPEGIVWDKLEEGMLENIPPLQQLYKEKETGNS